MKIPTTIANWVADAETAYGASLDAWFPADFDHAAFCADVPAMAERLGERWAGPTAAAAKARLEELSVAAFRGAYLGTLALLAAYDVEADPRDALDRLTRPLTDAERDLLDDRLAEEVAIVESGLALDAPRRAGGDSRAGAALTLARRVAEPIRAMLAPGLSVGAKALVSLGASAGPTSKVLSGVVHVAMAVATLRHVVAGEADGAEGEPALEFDPAQFDAAFVALADGVDEDEDEGRGDGGDGGEGAGGDDDGR